MQVTQTANFANDTAALLLTWNPVLLSSSKWDAFLFLYTAAKRSSSLLRRSMFPSLGEGNFLLSKPQIPLHTAVYPWLLYTASQKTEKMWNITCLATLYLFSWFTNQLYVSELSIPCRSADKELKSSTFKTKGAQFLLCFPPHPPGVHKSAPKISTDFPLQNESHASL